MAGIEASVLGWIIPAIVGIVAFWQLASNPWLRDVGWEAGGLVGGNFWSLSLGGSASLGEVAIGGWPLLWTLLQVVIVRVCLLQSRGMSPWALWAAVPSFSLFSLFLVLTVSDGSIWRTFLGAVAVSAVGCFWKFLDETRKKRDWGWIWDGFRLGFLWYLATIAVSAVFVLASAIVNRTAVSEGFGALGETSSMLHVLFFMFVPNLLGWAWSWISGAGVAAPAGAILSSQAPRVDDFPLPYWHLLPQTAGSAVILWIPVFLGVVLGAVSAYRRRNARLVTNLRPVAVGLVFLLSLIVCGLALSGISLGEANLAYLGPRPWAALGWTVLKLALPILLIVTLTNADTITGAKWFADWTQKRVQSANERTKAAIAARKDSRQPAEAEEAEVVVASEAIEGPPADQELDSDTGIDTAVIEAPTDTTTQPVVRITKDNLEEQ